MVQATRKIYPTKEDLDAFPIPLGCDVVVYVRFMRKALFYRKSENGYTLKHTFNKRGRKISIRKNDYVLTMDFDGSLSAGDSMQVFVREA